MIAAGKHPKYIAAQAGHSSAGFTLDRYGSLFETLPISPVEWWDDLIWPGGWHHNGTVEGGIRRDKVGERVREEPPETQINKGLRG